MRRSVKIAGLVVALGLAFALVISILAPPTSDRPRDEPDREPELFRLDGAESGFYPYLNDKRAFANRSPVNVVVESNLTQTLNVLQERPGARWNTTTPVEGERNATDPIVVNLSGTEIAWGAATGSQRYAYVHDGTGGEWVGEDAQLHDGTYFGYRYHMRMYESPADNESWVAIQAHSEHFDWFTLRHAVDGVQDAQNRVENDLMGQSYVERVWRAHLDNDGASDSDGWATVVELALIAPFLVLGGLRAPPEPSVRTTAREAYREIRERVTPRHGGLALTIVAILLGVRAAGIGLEEYAPVLSAHQIAGLLYPMLAFGLPTATYAIAHKLERRADAGMTAASALGVAFLADYGYVGVDTLPLDLLVHRTMLVIAIGLIASGSARRAARRSRFNATLATGSGLWIVLLVATLAGWV